MNLLDAHASHPDLFERQLVVAFTDDGSCIVGGRLSVYPNRHIVDASVSVVLDGWQRSLHASGRVGGDVDAVGPIIVAPTSDAGRFDLVVDEPRLGWAGSLHFEGASDATIEPRYRSSPGARAGDDSTTETQVGRARVDLVVEDAALPRPAAEPLRAVRLHARGIEPVDERPPGAPSHELPQQLFSRVVLELPRHRSAPAHNFVPRWHAGTRWLSGATVELGLTPSNGAGRVELTPVGRFAMRGLGFASPSWSLGEWHDEIAVGTEEWWVDALDPTDVHHLHTLHVVHASKPTGRGVGLAEVLALGPHRPSGLRGFTEGFAPGD